MIESDVDFIIKVLARTKHDLAAPDREPPISMLAAAAHSLATFWPAPRWIYTPRTCPRARLLGEDGMAIIGAAREMLIAAERWRDSDVTRKS